MDHIYRITFNYAQGFFLFVYRCIGEFHETKINPIINHIKDLQTIALMHLEEKLIVYVFYIFFALPVITSVFLISTASAATHIVADAIINSSGSSYTIPDDIYLDGGGTFTIDVTDSGFIRTTTGGLGAAIVLGRDAGTNATLNVGNGGQIDALGKLLIGQSGATGILNIESGGIVIAQDGGNIGAAGGVSGAATVRSGGQFISTGYMYVGGNSLGLLNIDSGGVFTSNSGFFGVGVNGHGTLNVEGNMTLNGGTPLEIGSAGTGIMNVRNGGTVAVASYTWVGPRSGDATLTVSGINSKLQTTGTGSFRIGDGSGSGAVLIEQGGNITINGGAVQIGKGQLGSSGSGALTITGMGSKFQSTATSDFEVGTGASSTGRLTISDNGQLDTNAVQILIGTGHSGALNIGAARGGWAVAAGSINQNNAINLGTNGELVFNHTDSNYEFASFIEGTGSIYQEHAGSVTILSSDNSSYSGDVVINAGTLQLGNGGTTGSIGSADIAINTGAHLNVNRSGNLTISGVISGGGQLQQNGTGITILTGANSYSGGTLVSIGVLQGNTTSLQGDIINNAALVFDQTITGIYSGALSGTGILTKQGSSDLTLAANAMTGQVNHNAGTLNINANKTLSIANGMTMASGTTLGVDISSSPSVEVTGGGLVLSGSNILNITGYSPTNDTGTYTLVTTASGISGSFVTMVGGSHLNTYVDLYTYLIGSGWIDTTGNNILARLELVWNNNDPASAHGTFNITGGNSFNVGVALADNVIPSALGFGWNGQDLTKTGAGTLVLNGVNTYTGHTDVQNGRLIVGSTAAHNNAQIAGNVDVQNAALLGGHGRVNGTVTVHGGGALAPGNSVGTLTVGDALFNSGSTFQVEVNPDGTADRLVADSGLGGTGTVAINAAAGLDIIAGAGNWDPSTSYLIIDTDGGVTGQFDQVTSNLAFLTKTVNYNIPNQVWLTMTRNGINFGDLGGTENESNTGKGVESLGGGNVVYDTIVSMSREQALNAFDNLSGEIYGSIRSAILTNRYARDAVNRHLSNDAILSANQLDLNKTLWIDTWGYDGRLAHDGNAAKLDYDGWGFLVGADAYNNGKTIIGVALGYEQIDIKTHSNRNSGADINAVHLLAYGRTSAGPIDIKAGIGYSRLDVDTTRHLNVGAIQSTNQASYNGHLIQAYVEGSHTFEFTKQTSISPFINVAYQHISVDSFTEKGLNAQLHNNSDRNYLITATAGIRGLWKLNDQSGLYGTLGWQHNMGDIAPHAQLNFIGGNVYTVKGTKVDRNNAILSFGGNYQIKPDMHLSAGYEGQFGNQNRSHALKVKFEWNF